MARNKHSAALFEVIHSHKELGTSRGGFPTPKWWFKKSKAAPAVVPPTQEQEELPSESVDDPTLSHSKSYTIAGSGRSAMRVDRDRSQVTMRMRFTTVVVVSFAIMVALGLAYVIGRHVAGGPDAASADTVDDAELLQPLNPIAPDPQKKTVPKLSPAPSHLTTLPITPIKKSDLVNPRPIGRDTTIEVLAPRATGKNYILVASYPPDKVEGKLVQSHLAQQACEALNKAGVPSSVDKVPPKYYSKEGWVAVISRHGFQKISAEESQSEMRAVEAVGKSNPKFTFNPLFFQWN